MYDLLFLFQATFVLSRLGVSAVPAKSSSWSGQGTITHEQRATIKLIHLCRQLISNKTQEIQAGEKISDKKAAVEMYKSRLMLSLNCQIKSAFKPDAASHILTQSISCNQYHALQKHHTIHPFSFLKLWTKPNPSDDKTTFFPPQMSVFMLDSHNHTFYTSK